MSPVSRGRKKKRNTKPSQPVAVEPGQACDCPLCAGEDFDFPQLADAMIYSAATVVMAEDPLEAELVGATFVSAEALGGADFRDALATELVPQFEERATAEALATLLAIRSVSDSQLAEAASDAAVRLVEAGVPQPGWAAELAEPTTVTECWRLADPEGYSTMLACAFERAGRSHAFLVRVDQFDCGAAGDILLTDAKHLPSALETMRDGGAHGLDLKQEPLEPAELRWHVENALDARAVHDEEQAELGPDDLPDDEDEGPSYPVLAALLRARMNILPVPTRPKAPHGNGDGGLGRLGLPIQGSGDGDDWVSAIAPLVASGLVRTAKLPAKRKKSDGPAPIYQLKVGLRDAKPPIWRRLEVPADVTLGRLHTMIQIAFDWQDSHLHVFETPYGEFGVADADLGYRSERPVTLEQVAPGVGDKIRYTYDFGDGWEHDILVEKVLDRDQATTYPRCTGGRRAAPPDDCGGIWGYVELVQILSDPADPQHKDRLEWLGLDDATDFAPEKFEAAAVTRALAGLA